MRKILFGVLGCLVAVCTHAAQVANLDYVHKLIQQKWDISILIKADNPMLAANMKYLLTAVDVANEILNGEKTTDYGNGEFATLHAADTVATNTAVETLIEKEEKYKFSLVYETNYTNNHVTTFNFDISAAGEFVVDWGDGTVETITKPDTTNITYSHTYLSDGIYTIKFTGQATKYSSGAYIPAISFNTGQNRSDLIAASIRQIDGSLGAIFGTLPDGTQPRFIGTFMDASINVIPEELFNGILGCPTENMFFKTFMRSNIDEIPLNLFSGLSTDCVLPSGVFIFTFMYAFLLTGPSARINGQYLYEIWPDATSSQVEGMYYEARSLSDYSTMPAVWRSYID